MQKISRMLGKDKKPAPLVLIELSKDYKSIFDLKKCCGLDISVESLKVRQDIMQCHRCQLFGHAQKNCRADFKWLKCGEEHSTHLCTKPRTTPPKCGNCGGEHLSKYLYCKENPNNPNKNQTNQQPSGSHSPDKPQNNPLKKASTSNKVNTNTTYASAVKNSIPQTDKKATKNNLNDLSAILGQMLVEFSSLKPNNQQKLEFLNKTQQIINLYNGNNN